MLKAFLADSIQLYRLAFKLESGKHYSSATTKPHVLLCIYKRICLENIRSNS